jgi:hypothetical protein
LPRFLLWTIAWNKSTGPTLLRQKPMWRARDTGQSMQAQPSRQPDFGRTQIDGNLRRLFRDDLERALPRPFRRLLDRPDARPDARHDARPGPRDAGSGSSGSDDDTTAGEKPGAGARHR